MWNNFYQPHNTTKPVNLFNHLLGSSSMLNSEKKINEPLLVPAEKNYRMSMVKVYALPSECSMFAFTNYLRSQRVTLWVFF